MVGYRIQSRLEDNYYLHSWKCKRLRLRLEGAEGVHILHAITLLLPHLIQACRFLARCVSGTDGHVWKEITKTIHVYADKVPKKIGDAYVVLSSFSKMKQEVQWLIGLKGLALYKEWLGVFFICIKIPAFRSSTDKGVALLYLPHGMVLYPFGF